MVQWHRFVQPIPGGRNAQMQSSVLLWEGSVMVHCGDTDMLVGVSGDASQVCIRLNGETHQYDRGLLRRVVVHGARGNHDIELPDDEFDMLVVAHGSKGEMQMPRNAGMDLHAARAKRHRADDFGLV